MIWKYTILWLGLVVIAILNGLLREKVFRQHLKELPAHQFSTVTLLALISIFTWIFSIIWPLELPGHAFAVGAIWLTLTIAFEFIFGHYAVKKPWNVLLTDYNLSKGRIWIFVLIWTFFAPLVFYVI
jgi:hypothetical protein